jgi:hypothetical protein
MKEQINEIKRMQELAGMVNEDDRELSIDANIKSIFDTRRRVTDKNKNFSVAEVYIEFLVPKEISNALYKKYGNRKLSIGELLELIDQRS